MLAKVQGRVRVSSFEWLTIPISGYIYDVNSGKLIEVEAATKAGATA
jgi:hypothetical protein